jgi:myo-inositol-1(or 4)-monophosphatase
MNCCEAGQYQKTIQNAFEQIRPAAVEFAGALLDVESKGDGSPVTVADAEIGRLLQEILWRPGDGWLSEEDDELRATDSEATSWIVDPIDGTMEFTQKRHDWVVSVACIRRGRVVAGGIMAPIAKQMFLDHRCAVKATNGNRTVAQTGLQPTSRILASRSEVARGSWDVFEPGAFERVDVGSVAYKLALVSAGLAEGTISLAPKNSWDIAAGILLVEAAGGRVVDLSGRSIDFSRARFKINGLIAGSDSLVADVESILKQPETVVRA